MILKASQRGGGQDLARHLMRLDDNEHMALHELRGFASDNLRDAFREVEAVSLGTKCKQYLFSLSLSPPEDAKVPVEDFEAAISQVEKHLNLDGQPRAIVFHEKEGRRHAHCVWSRIDAESMTAIPMSFYKTKLQGVSRELYLDHGWTLPRGLETPGMRNPTNFSLAEWQQAKRQGIDPRWLKSTLQDCWKMSDNGQSFGQALQERGLFLAKGDKRAHVVLDHQGDVWSLPRLLDLKTKEVRDRLGTGDDLKSVDDTKALIGKAMTPAIRRHVEESRKSFARRASQLNARKAEMTDAHRKERADLEVRQRLEWENESKARAAKLPTGLRGLWHRITGKYQEQRRQGELEAVMTSLRHAQERQVQIDRQREVRARLQQEIRQLRTAQAAQLLELRQDIGRFLKFSKFGRAQNAQLAQDRSPGVERGPLRLGR